MSATDQSTITAVAGGIAIAGALSNGTGNATAVSVGVSVAINTIEDKTASPGLGGVQAYIDASTVAAGGLNVSATSTPTITVVSFAGGLAVAASHGGDKNAVAVAASGAVALNTVTMTVHSAISNTPAPVTSSGLTGSGAQVTFTVNSSGGLEKITTTPAAEGFRVCAQCHFRSEHCRRNRRRSGDHQCPG